MTAPKGAPPVLDPGVALSRLISACIIFGHASKPEVLDAKGAIIDEMEDVVRAALMAAKAKIDSNLGVTDGN